MTGGGQGQGAEKDAGVVYDMIRERDHYRARCEAAVERISREAAVARTPDGPVTHLVLPIESWRSIRALLQEQPHPLPPGAAGGES